MARNPLLQKAINYGKHFPDAVMANAKYGFPGKKIKVIGVTGTDGKTTTVNMIYQVLRDAGVKVSMVSTINATIAGKSYDTGFHVTSPAARDIQRFLKMAVDHGDQVIVLEITSHALDQFRSWGIPFEVGVITNITREHLDYHRTMENYILAKAKLIQSAKVAVLNKDDENYSQLKKLVQGKVVDVSIKNPADLTLKKYPLTLKIPGEYNLSNALQTLAVAQVLGVETKKAVKTLESFTSLDGRMEEIPNKKGLTIMVDFAHTPNGLEKVLQALRPKTRGKIIAVFGAASQRDVGKRPIMGQIAARFADVVILTAEDPRFEDPNTIIEEIAAGSLAVGAKVNQTLFKEPNRQKAIELALSMAKKGDTIGIFGKGHEKTMNIKGKETPWSDKAAVLKALKNGG